MEKRLLFNIAGTAFFIASLVVFTHVLKDWLKLRQIQKRGQEAVGIVVEIERFGHRNGKSFSTPVLEVTAPDGSRMKHFAGFLSKATSADVGKTQRFWYDAKRRERTTTGNTGDLFTAFLMGVGAVLFGIGFFFMKPKAAA